MTPNGVSTRVVGVLEDSRRSIDPYSEDHMSVRKAVIPAAGLGTRMGKGTAEKAGTSRKQFMLLDGSPILMHTVRKFLASPRVGVIVIAVRAEDTDWVRDILAAQFETGRVRVVEGGNSRQESVQNALASLGPEYELVAVHDAVRPFIDLDTIHMVGQTGVPVGLLLTGAVLADLLVEEKSGGPGTRPAVKLRPFRLRTPQMHRLVEVRKHSSAV